MGVVCVAVFLALTRISWAGDLGGYGNEVSFPVQPGVAVSVGMGPLRPGHEIRIDSIRLHRADRGVALVGAVVHDVGDGMVGFERRFPPPTIHLRDASKAEGRVGSRRPGRCS
jgi:hypothetical protein